MTQRPYILSRLTGETTYDDGELIPKQGAFLTSNEIAAVALLKGTNVPVPHLFGPNAETDRLNAESNDVEKTLPNGMRYREGEVLSDVWSGIEKDHIKEEICRQTWALVGSFRNVAKPGKFQFNYQCCADGTASPDALIAPPSKNQTKPLSNDAELRRRISDRYATKAGGYTSGGRWGTIAPEEFPVSDKAVFTHGDISPRNIVVAVNTTQNVILGLVGWESAGWYPNYWEYANMMRSCNDSDWRQWMQRTAPETWDVSTLDAARLVLGFSTVRQY